MDRFVHLPGSLKAVGRTTGASTTEAIVAAVWLDSGRDFDTVHRVIHNLHIGVGCTQSRLPEKTKSMHDGNNLSSNVLLHCLEPTNYY
ncbi:hypothetical protein GGI43DRAFT_391689 [Trichoderma evansii]